MGDTEPIENEAPIESKNVKVMLNAVINDPNFVDREDGSLIVRNVTLLAPGTWTDSLARTPCRYRREVLGKCATNWEASGLWTRHAGGASRAVTDKVGLVRSPRQDSGTGAIVGDLWYHRKSQASRDTAELVLAGIIDSVSVEMGVREVYNKTDQVYDAQELTFTGLAHVDQGACSVCKVPKRTNEAIEQNEITVTKEKDMAEPKVVEAPKPTELEIFKVEAEKATALINERLFALSAELESTKRSLYESMKALEESTKKNTELTAKVEELGKIPVPKTLAPMVEEMKESEFVGKLPRISKGSVTCE